MSSEGYQGGWRSGLIWCPVATVTMRSQAGREEPLLLLELLPGQSVDYLSLSSRLCNEMLFFMNIAPLFQIENLDNLDYFL